MSTGEEKGQCDAWSVTCASDRLRSVVILIGEEPRGLQVRVTCERPLRATDAPVRCGEEWQEACKCPPRLSVGGMSLRRMLM